MELNKYIDHTNLKNIGTKKDIEKLCNEAREYQFQSVCIHPYYVSYAASLLSDTNVEICTVIGFPLGMNTTEVKVYEAIDATEKGATEVDMVINVAALKNKDYDYIKKEIEEVRDAIDGKVLKVIIETALLSTEEIIRMTNICNETFVNFIKTSTGFQDRGASIEDINTINTNKSELLEIKASGGIKDLKSTNEFIEAGATRIGTSNGVSIMKENINEII